MSNELSSWLINLDGFKEKYNDLLYASIASQFPSVAPAHKVLESKIEYEYLLNCASMLSDSQDPKCIDVSLRICQHTLTSNVPAPHKMAASFILNKMQNIPAINLAKRNNLIDQSFHENFSMMTKIDWFKTELQCKIYTKTGKDVIANRFQKDAWEALSSTECLVLSAPTSVGKSFIILKWIAERVSAASENIIYLVPTRALIHQVSSDIADVLSDVSPDKIEISTIPHGIVSSGRSNIFIFTQERLHYFMERCPSDFKISTLIIDEAHKIGDGYRGILLQQAIEKIIRVGVQQIIFATPSAVKPESLMEDVASTSSKKSIESDVVTVNQNLFWVRESSNDSKTWTIEFWQNNEKTDVGTFTIDSEPNTLRKRLTFIAYKLGMSSYGNIIYADGASDAEEIAILLHNMIGNDIEDEELREASKVAQQAVHGKYRLTTVLNRGIAFHYGNMPLILRLEIERLFKKGVIRFLICTSTLIEGVNLPCRNIFLRGPKKGRNKIMNLDDFWNLAGRAGRWGKEFQGNIFCVDPTSKDWKDGQAPTSKTKFAISRTWSCPR